MPPRAKKNARKQRQTWSSEQLDRLLAGYEKYHEHHNKWVLIREEFDLPDRCSRVMRQKVSQLLVDTDRRDLEVTVSLLK
jgi:hypothetical protein